MIATDFSKHEQRRRFGRRLLVWMRIRVRDAERAGGVWCGESSTVLRRSSRGRRNYDGNVPIDNEDRVSVGFGVHTPKHFEWCTGYNVDRGRTLSVRVRGTDMTPRTLTRQTVMLACDHEYTPTEVCGVVY
jgi:hypothetical protein